MAKRKISIRIDENILEEMDRQYAEEMKYRTQQIEKLLKKALLL